MSSSGDCRSINDARSRGAIGQCIGVSQMQVSRILRHALARLRALARVEDERRSD